VHDRPYYGKQPQAEGLWVRGQAKDGTTRFYRVATAYVILNGLRLTLAIRFVRSQEAPVILLDHLLQRPESLRLEVASLYLDKWFDGIPVIQYLTRRGQPALIAHTIRGRRGGTRALCRGHQSH